MLILEKEKETTELIQVENTPFQLLKMGDKFRIVMGKYALTEEMSEKEAKTLISKKDWSLLLSVFMVILETFINKEDKQ